VSVTDVRETAEGWCKVLESKRYVGIELLEIESVGQGWNHSAQRLWKARDIIRSFDLQWKPYYKIEYLVEQRIPAEHVKRHKWE